MAHGMSSETNSIEMTRVCSIQMFKDSVGYHSVAGMYTFTTPSPQLFYRFISHFYMMKNNYPLSSAPEMTLTWDNFTRVYAMAIEGIGFRKEVS